MSGISNNILILGLLYLMLILLLMTIAVNSEAQKRKDFEFVETQDITIDEELGFMIRIQVNSAIECTRACIQKEGCSYVRVSEIHDGGATTSWKHRESLWCELFSLDDLGRLNDVDQQPLTSAIDAKIFINLHQNIPTKKDDCTTSKTCPLAERDDIKLMSDLDIPSTQTTAHINSFKGQFAEVKVVVRDENSGDLNVFSTYSNYFKRGIASVILVYTMERDNETKGFKNESASRIAHSFYSNGTVYRTVILLNGTSYQTTTHMNNMRLLMTNVGRYSLSTETDANDDMEIIKSWFEKGYKLCMYDHSFLASDSTFFAGYLINKRFVFFGKNNWIPNYMNLGVRWSMDKIRIRNQVGTPGIIHSRSDNSFTGFLGFDPKWNDIGKVNDPGSGEYVDIEKIRGAILNGTALRIGLNNVSYFDINDVHYTEGLLTFVLPQQIMLTPELTFAKNPNSIQSMLSSMGILILCTHQFESQIVEDYKSMSAASRIQVFAHTKTWTRVLCVSSNGVVTYGSVRVLAQAVLEGRDVHVLMTWQGHEDRMRLIRMDMVTIHHQNKESELVIGESVTTWSSIYYNGWLTLSDRCDREKLLVKSNGQVESLVYNTYRRDDVLAVDGVDTCWFLQ